MLNFYRFWYDAFFIFARNVSSNYMIKDDYQSSSKTINFNLINFTQFNF